LLNALLLIGSNNEENLIPKASRVGIAGSRAIVILYGVRCVGGGCFAESAFNHKARKLEMAQSKEKSGPTESQICFANLRVFCV